MADEEALRRARESGFTVRPVEDGVAAAIEELRYRAEAARQNAERERRREVEAGILAEREEKQAVEYTAAADRIEREMKK